MDPPSGLPNLEQKAYSSSDQNPLFSSIENQSPSNSILLEKKGLGTQRRSTPDSEVLASSDDDHEHVTTSRSGQTVPVHKPVRRGSWLSEVHSMPLQHRKASLGNASIPTSSQPTTPSGEHGVWNSSPGIARAGLSKQNMDTRFPFEIPLEPVFKSARSSSYSVGQKDEDELSPPNLPVTGSARGGRMRPLRQSMLGDSARDSNTLGLVLEDEDDGGGSSMSEYNQRYQAATSRTDGDRGSQQLRKQAAHERARQRLLSSPIDPAAESQIHQAMSAGANRSNADYAIEEYDEQERMLQQSQGGITGSPTHMHSFDPDAPLDFVDQRPIPGLKKTQWQSSLGFGSIPEPPQSRRHSFADVPASSSAGTFPKHSDMDLQMRRAFVKPRQYEEDSESQEFPSPTKEVEEDQQDQQDQPSQQLQQQHHLESQLNDLEIRIRQKTAKNTDSNIAFAAGYCSGMGAPAARVLDSQEALNPFKVEGPLSNPFAVPSRIPNQYRTLYLVQFKCARAEIYYSPTDSGLQIEEGEMVIVEGDRGQDLGIVKHCRLTEDQARDLKEKSVLENYKWLMMFSSLYGRVEQNSDVGLMASRAAIPGGMGPRVNPQNVPRVQHNARPKMIKRKANEHEIYLLRDKEGTEAKAKRVAQGKASDRGFRMEILDAEFQLDLKKLTFYYYADSYIDFNLLVTDLFKVYKTRIWMSAVNPASFATPPGISHLTSAISPGAVGVVHSSFGPSPPRGAVGSPYAGNGTAGFDSNSASNTPKAAGNFIAIEGNPLNGGQYGETAGNVGGNSFNSPHAGNGYRNQSHSNNGWGNATGFRQGNFPPRGFGSRAGDVSAPDAIQNPEVREAIARVEETDPHLRNFDHVSAAQPWMPSPYAIQGLGAFPGGSSQMRAANMHPPAASFSPMAPAFTPHHVDAHPQAHFHHNSGGSFEDNFRSMHIGQK
ncbi:hypothetical protein K402DRAFT_416556 [Aulographum hederae CBS 113979]|uniref:PSP1 C-terminal domain-containing protein n=1 Tax=Aulographum hederae CBS 113979 TaxID=1176131 RepID=A0A6G1HFR7_9PEZI|nr:hypothetical protein K402DRAFT_416556 [Aulographum hederae CBS 113979]